MRGVMDFCGELNALEKTIAPQLHEVRSLFPEYTAHDWDGHIQPLFDLACRLFGEETILRLSPVDRFLLAVGLFAHDWGMAVGPEERRVIVSGGKHPDGTPAFTLLDDETTKLLAFCRQERLQVDAQGHIPALQDRNLPHLAEYIRRTHAWRSGARINRHILERFGDQGLAESASAVCVGHWLDFKDLHDARLIKTSRMTYSGEAHPRLIALLVRLTDLFDVGADRTPYAMRRFVGPSNPQSVVEWAKHEALDPAGCQLLPNGDRKIYLGGTCYEPDLWPSLLNLRTFCEDQLRQATGLLSEEKPAANEIRIHPVLDWRVEARGFDPTPVRFEFDRAATFRLLAQEIYSAEPHIFLRELLQNAIDANRQLIARWHQRDPRLEPKPEDLPIHFHVERRANGRIIVRCRDFGIGMNRHMATDYLARVGSSYYQSEEFARDEVQMDAISRFGIGLLSVFMVADGFDIKTRRPCEFGGDETPLQITIPDLERHFHIRPFLDDAWYGTEVRVEVIPQKLAAVSTPSYREQGKSTPSPFLDPIGYLSFIASFVEFPIYVEDGNRRVLILHPKADREFRPKFVSADAIVQQFSGAYDWRSVLREFHRCPDPAVLTDYRVDVRKTLGIEGVDGFVTFPVPCSADGDVHVHLGGMMEGNEMSVTLPTGKTALETWGAIAAAVENDSSGRPNDVCCWRPPNCMTHLFQDGIYVSSEEKLERNTRNFPFCTQVRLDYRKGAKAELAPSRATFAREPDYDHRTIVGKAMRHALVEEGRHALSQPADKRLRTLGWMQLVFALSEHNLVTAIPSEHYPIIILKSPGRYVCEDVATLLNGGLRVIPEAMCNHSTADHALDSLRERNEYPQPQTFAGQPWAIEFPHRFGEHSILDEVKSLQNSFLSRRLFAVGLKFVKFPAPAKGPHPVQIRSVRRTMEPEDYRPLARKVLDDLYSLSDEEWGRLRAASVGDDQMPLVRQTFIFPAPFRNRFAHGMEYFNLLHPLVRWLVRAAAWAALRAGPFAERGSPPQLIHDWLHLVRWQLRKNQSNCYQTFAAHWHWGVERIQRVPELALPASPPCPSYSEFIPHSFPETELDAFHEKQNKGTIDFHSKEPWGYEITEWPSKQSGNASTIET